MTEIKCPYCQQYVEIDTDDHYEDEEEYSCPKCSKNFEVSKKLEIRYSACGKADCLNGADHKWKPQVGSPAPHFRGKYICEDCSATKNVKSELATDEDWKAYYNEWCKKNTLMKNSTASSVPSAYQKQ